MNVIVCYLFGISYLNLLQQLILVCCDVTVDNYLVIVLFAGIVLCNGSTCTTSICHRYCVSSTFICCYCDFVANVAPDSS